MAKVSGPLYSMSASGSLKGSLTFSVRSSGQQVRFQRKQSDKITSARSVQRDLYSSCVNSWNNLSTNDKNTYNDLASKKGYTGYNLYMQSCMLSSGITSYSAYYGYGGYGHYNYGLV